MANTDTTSTSPSKPGSGLGKKIRGATEIVHGVGETLRGTMLDTVDSLGNEIGLRSKNDGIAQQGRLEIQRGLENWKGAPTTASAIPPSHSSYGQPPHNTTGGVAGPGSAAPYGGGPGATKGDNGEVPPQSYASGNQHAHASTGAYGPGSSYPSHPPIVGTEPEPQGPSTQQPRSTGKFGSGLEHDSPASGGLNEGRALDQQNPPSTHHGVSPNQSQEYHPNPTGTVHPKT